MDISERLKNLRKSLNMNQSDFAESVGLIQPTYSTYERGSTRVPDVLIKSICSVYGISEDWLRTGIGDMMPSATDDEQLADFVADVFSESDDSMRKQFIKALSRLSPEGWQAFDRFCTELLSEMNKGEPLSIDSHSFYLLFCFVFSKITARNSGLPVIFAAYYG